MTNGERCHNFSVARRDFNVREETNGVQMFGMYAVRGTTSEIKMKVLTEPNVEALRWLAEPYTTGLSHARRAVDAKFELKATFCNSLGQAITKVFARGCTVVGIDFVEGGEGFVVVDIRPDYIEHIIEYGQQDQHNLQHAEA